MRQIVKATPEHEAGFRSTFELRADLKGNPEWEAAYEHAATHKLWPDELTAIGPALVRRAIPETMRIGFEDALLIQRVERLDPAADPKRPAYHFEGRRLKWGSDIGPEDMERLKNAEVFIREDAAGRDASMILMDVYGKFRERPI